jgi:hypothetical protein
MTTTRTRGILRGMALTLALGAAAPAAAQAARDSAGIRLVDNATPAWTPGRAWRLSAEPVLTLGGGAGAEDRLGRIVGATRLSDGRLVVADQTTSELRFYDPAGRPLASVVARVESRGMTRDLQTIARLAGDSIAVGASDVAAVHAPSGAAVRTVRFGPFAPGALQTPFATPLGRFDDGTTIVADFPQGRRRPAGAQRWVDSASLFLADRTGAVVRPLGTAPMVVFAAGVQHPAPVDFAPQAAFAASGRTFYWGFPEAYAIRVYEVDGAGWRLARIVRRAWTPRALSGAEIDAYVDGWMQLWSKKTGAEREAERRAMRAQAYPDSLPAYSAILATPAGELWVREPDLTGAPGCWCLAGVPTVPSRWSVFDAGGRWLGEVAMPARFVPLEVGADYVLGRSRDAEGVSRAALYRLEKPR